ncbi:MAG: VOC family protein [Chloroflexi bacterium]|nr:MAG: VOC family protein [Chloroflexota bacterium]
MEVKELGHLVLYVRDLERSRRFYGDLLGWKEIPGMNEGFPAAAFSSGRTHHELLLIEVGPDAAPIPRGRWPPAVIGRVMEAELAAGPADTNLRGAREQLQTMAEERVIIGHLRRLLFGVVRDPKNGPPVFFVRTPSWASRYLGGCSI